MVLDVLPISRAGFKAQDGSELPDHINIPTDRPTYITFKRSAP
jgi:hypothetical protein